MIRKRTVLIEEEISPYVMMRVGIFEHIKNKSMDSDMYLVYSLMLHLADWETGEWWGCAAAMASELGNVWGVKKTERVLNKLVKGKYIVSKYQKGRTGNYLILINNFVPTKGPNAWKKLREVHAGNPLTTDKTGDKSVATLDEVPTKLASEMSVSASIQTVSATISSPKMSSNQYSTNKGLDSPQNGIDECMNVNPRPGRRINVEEA
jgi:hypothetical protein